MIFTLPESTSTHRAGSAVRSVVVIAMLLSLLAPAIPVRAYEAVQASCRDTVANYSAQCVADNLEPFEDVTFKAVKPDGSVVRFDGKADKAGKATASINRYHTQHEGQYQVAAYLSWLKEPDDLTYDTFDVVPDPEALVEKKKRLMASITGAMGGPIAEFKITAPASAKVGEAFDVTVCAIDETRQPVTDYRGTIFFFVETDVNATVPYQEAGYTFTGTDQNACHTFAKGVTLTKAGQATLMVLDLDNPEISADVVITATDSGGASANTNTNTNASSATTITITSPLNGSTYGDSTINILGKGPKSSKIILYEGSQELGSAQSDANGNFSFTAKGLTDGKHTIHAVALDATGKTLGRSADTSITISSRGPELLNVEITPGDTVPPNATISVTVTSEPKLSRVRVVLDSIPHDLPESTTAGKYQATFAAPGKPGVYDIRVGLTNALNQETAPTVNKKLTVKAAEEKLAITAALGDKTGTARVTWKPLQDSSQVKEYRVRYGTSRTVLQSETKVNAPTTTADVSGLSGNTLYYFTVTPVYADGRDGVTSDTASLQMANAALTVIENLKVIGGVQRINLTWDEPDFPAGSPDTVITQYIIEYSSTREAPEGQARTETNVTSWYVPNLLDCKDYFLQITAVNSGGRAIARSALVSGKTLCGDNACQQVSVSGLQALGYNDGSQTLVWNPVLGARGYRVYAGPSAGDYQYGSWDVTDTVFPIFADRFPANTEVYFAIQALGEGDCFTNAALSKAIRTRVGPGVWVALVVSLAAGTFFLIYKEKMRMR